MFCSNCGGQLEAGASFCQHCGASVGATAGSEVGGGATAPNPNLEKAKDISKNYFSFIKDHFKAPVRHGFSVDGTQWINGLITLILFSLLPALATYLVIKSMSFWGSPPLGRTLFLPMVYMAIMLLIIIGVIFIISKMARSTASFQDVLARFGALMIIPTVFIILLFILGLLQISSSVLVGLVSFGYIVGFLVSIVLTAYSFSKESNGGLDSYYVILLTFLCLVIALIMFGEELFGGLANTFYRF